MNKLKLTCPVRFTRDGAGARKTLASRPAATKPPPAGRLPRITRLMALALRFEKLLRDGVVRDQADLARLGGVTRARLTQLMNMTLLPPDIQEQLLLLPTVERGRAPLLLADLRPIAQKLDWQEQRNCFDRLFLRKNAKAPIPTR